MSLLHTRHQVTYKAEHWWQVSPVPPEMLSQELLPLYIFKTQPTTPMTAGALGKPFCTE